MMYELDAAIRRLRAVITVLDEDLAATSRLLGPLTPRQLTPDAWAAAEATRRQVEEHLAVTAAAEASRRAVQWQAHGETAIARQQIVVARHALAQAEAANEEAAALALECNATQVFLAEWAVRVTRLPDQVDQPLNPAG